MDIEIFSKFILNGFIAGSLYAVLALGLALLYGVLRVVNLAHGEYAVLGAFCFFVFYVQLGWPLIPSLLIGLTIFSLLVFIFERLTFRPVRDAPGVTPLIISIALSIFIKNMLLLIFDARAQTLPAPFKSYGLFGSDVMRITNIQIIILIASVLLMLAVWLLLKKTRLGKAIRAVSDNKEMAAILGIPVNKIISITFVISGLLAAVAGILAAFDANLHPNQGTFFTIKSFAAVIIGGIGSIPGAVMGAYFIGLMENIIIALPLGDLTVPSNYKDAVAFAALILLLYFKPTGFLGARQEEAARK